MNKNKSTPAYAAGANPQRVQAVQELRRSNATAPKPVKTMRKQRTRSGSRRAAISQAW